MGATLTQQTAQLLFKNETKWEMKFFTPTQIWHAKRYSRGMSQNALDNLVSLLHIRYLLAPQTPILSSDTAVKSAKCKTPFLQSVNTLQLKTYTKVKTFIRLFKNISGFGFIIYK